MSSLGVNDYTLDRLEFTAAGQGAPPVLLMHGWGGDCRTMEILSQRLAAHRKVWSVSLPGFGASPEPPAAWGSLEYARVVARWLRAQGIGPAEVIAHSFGGRVALQLAASDPGRVAKLVLIASAGLRMHKSAEVRFRQAMAKMLRLLARPAGKQVKGWLEEKRRRLGSADWQAASPVMKGVLARVIGEDLSEPMRRIAAPTLLIYGSQDTATPPDLGRRIAGLVAGAKLVVLPGVGHYPFIEQPGETLSQVWRHLDLPSAW